MKAKPPKAKPSPTMLMREMARVDQLRAWLGEAADAQLLLDTIEGETQALEMLDVVIDEWESDKGHAEKAKARAQRIEKRAERGRFLAQAIMEKIGQQKLVRPGYTATIAKGTPSVHVTDAAVVPRKFLAPDKLAIRSALCDGENVPGCTLNNVPPVLRISTK